MDINDSPTEGTQESQQSEPEPEQQPVEAQPQAPEPTQPGAAETAAEQAPSVLSVAVNLTEEQLAEGAYYPGVRGVSSLDDVLHQQAYNDAFQLSMVLVTLDGQPVEGEALTALLDTYQQALAANDALATPEPVEGTEGVAEVNGQESPAEVLKDVLKAKRGSKKQG